MAVLGRVVGNRPQPESWMDISIFFFSSDQITDNRTENTHKYQILKPQIQPTPYIPTPSPKPLFPKKSALRVCLAAQPSVLPIGLLDRMVTRPRGRGVV